LIKELLEFEICDDIVVELKKLVTLLHLRPKDQGLDDSCQLMPETLHEQLVKIV
jgi:hypothetical protein